MPRPDFEPHVSAIAVPITDTLSYPYKVMGAIRDIEQNGREVTLVERQGDRVIIKSMSRLDVGKPDNPGQINGPYKPTDHYQG